jgi:hypothetical protein
MKRIITTALIASTATSVACFELPQTTDVMGNFEVQYANNLRVYINDELVAEVQDGEDADIELDGEIIQVSTLCSDEGVECPDETFWNEVAVDQPWGPDYQLLNFVNLDVEDENAGARIGGLLEEDGSYALLSGLALGANGACAAIGVGTVTGAFSADATTMEDGVIAYGWAGGCVIDGVEIGVAIRIETDFTATRTGDYDVSSVTPEEPIDEEGEVVDPEEPEEEYATEGENEDTGLAL